MVNVRRHRLSLCEPIPGPDTKHYGNGQSLFGDVSQVFLDHCEPSALTRHRQPPTECGSGSISWARTCHSFKGLPFSYRPCACVRLPLCRPRASVRRA
jgi:hypothetical protein